MIHTTLGQQFWKDIEAEAPATRKCLENIPPELFGWKPHEKSMAMGYLALIVAEVPAWVATTAEKPEIDFMTFPHPDPKSGAELVAYFDKNLELARNALKDVSDEELAKPFELKAGGHPIMSVSKSVNIGSSIRHWIHHRGQLTVYLRLNNIGVPALYGPSADDKGGFSF